MQTKSLPKIQSPLQRSGPFDFPKRVKALKAIEQSMHKGELSKNQAATHNFSYSIFSNCFRDFALFETFHGVFEQRDLKAYRFKYENMPLVSSSLDPGKKRSAYFYKRPDPALTEFWLKASSPSLVAHPLYLNNWDLFGPTVKLASRFFGMSEKEESSFAVQIHRSYLPDSEQVVFTADLYAPPSRLSPLVFSQVLLADAKGVKNRFNPFCRNMEGLHDRHFVILPSASLIEIALKVCFPNSFCKPSYKVSHDPGPSLPVEYFLSELSQQRRPCQLWDGKKIDPDDPKSYQIDGRGSYGPLFLTLHDLAHTIEESRASLSIRSARNLICEAIKDMTERKEDNKALCDFIDADYLADICPENTPFIPTMLQQLIKSNPYWTSEHNHTLARHMALNKALWGQKVGITWEDLPVSDLWRTCTTYAIDCETKYKQFSSDSSRK